MSSLGRRTAKEVEQAAHDALKIAAERVLEDSNRHIGVGDPAVDPDPAFTLAEHGHIDLPPDGLVARIRYDGPYAAWQHEDVHAKHPRGGGPKFLENALKSILPQLEGIVAAEVRARVKDPHSHQRTKRGG